VPASTTRRSIINTDNVATSFEQIDGQEVVWGWTQQAQDYQDGTSIHTVVAANHFGVEFNDGRQIPARPILDLNFDERSENLTALAIAINERMVDARVNDPSSVLRNIGQIASSEFARDIANGLGPLEPLADSTIARKGHSQPWIDSDHALSQVDFEIRNAGNR